MRPPQGHRSCWCGGAALMASRGQTPPYYRSFAGAARWSAGCVLAIGAGAWSRACLAAGLHNDFLAEQADNPGTCARCADHRPPRAHHRPPRRAAGGQHAGGQRLGQPARAGRGALERLPSWRARWIWTDGWRGSGSPAIVEREFVYLRRHMNPARRRRAGAGLPGVHLLREYRRYYPAGEVTGHLLGFTNIDDAGRRAGAGVRQLAARRAGAQARAARPLGASSSDVESIVPRVRGDAADLAGPAHPVPGLPGAEGGGDAAQRRAPGPRCAGRAPARCWRWSTSRPTTPTTARSVMPSRYRNRAMPPTSSSPVRASSR
jgi:hypothetical protein